jgi:predicted ester cyclase
VDALAIDDTVVIRAALSGTHTGTPYRGKPATGKAVTFSGINIIRIAEGKVAQLWTEYDYLSLLQQLDIVPSDEEIVAANERAADAPA